jgi:release factor glutamine methyltransferase
MPPTVLAALSDARARLAAAGVGNPGLDAALLLGEVLGVPRERLRTAPGRVLTADQATRFEALVTAREARRPMGQLLRRQEFWSLEFLVTPEVLSPRPETELLVEAAARALLSRTARHRQPLAVDVGTGTGCIAVSLAVEVPTARVHATDVSEDALEVARANVERHGVGQRVTLHLGDLLAPLTRVIAPGSVDVVVSNPPYVRRSEAGEVDPEVLWEPAVAVFAEREPAELYGRIAAAAAPFLAAGGELLLELPGAGSDPVVDAVARTGGYRVTELSPDLSGVPRLLRALRL